MVYGCDSAAHTDVELQAARPFIRMRSLSKRSTTADGGSPPPGLIAVRAKAMSRSSASTSSR
jgi:hypothetical protein